VTVPENKSNRIINSSGLNKLLNPIVRFFEWIAKGQKASAPCKG
jgi:hypothetical protein